MATFTPEQLNQLADVIGPAIVKKIEDQMAPTMASYNQRIQQAEAASAASGSERRGPLAPVPKAYVAPRHFRRAPSQPGTPSVLERQPTLNRHSPTWRPLHTGTRHDARIRRRYGGAVIMARGQGITGANDVFRVTENIHGSRSAAEVRHWYAQAPFATRVLATSFFWRTRSSRVQHVALTIVSVARVASL